MTLDKIVTSNELREFNNNKMPDTILVVSHNILKPDSTIRRLQMFVGKYERANVNGQMLTGKCERQI